MRLENFDSEFLKPSFPTLVQSKLEVIQIHKEGEHKWDSKIVTGNESLLSFKQQLHK